MPLLPKFVVQVLWKTCPLVQGTGPELAQNATALDPFLEAQRGPDSSDLWPFRLSLVVAKSKLGSPPPQKP